MSSSVSVDNFMDSKKWRSSLRNLPTVSVCLSRFITSIGSKDNNCPMFIKLDINAYKILAGKPEGKRQYFKT
jgi:hypothetical protein